METTITPVPDHPTHIPSAPIALLSPLGRHGGTCHGGITPVVLNLAKALSGLGHRVDLLTPFADGVDQSSLATTNATLVPLPRRGTARKRALRSYVASHQPKGLIAAGHSMNDLICSVPAGDARRIASIHNHQSREMEDKGPLKRWRRRVQLRRWSRLANAMVAVSEGVALDLRENFEVPADRLKVIHNPVDIERIQALATEAVDHPWLQNDPTVPVIIAVGRLAVQKDYPTLLRAFAALQNRRTSRLIILGEGDLRTALQTQISELGLGDRVDMPGFVGNPYAYMARATVFCLSSAWEGFGNVLVEALACGTPVVSTRCPSGPAEILDNGRYGRLVPVGDANALSNALAEQLDAPPPPAEAASRFSLERIGAQYADLLGLGHD